MKMISRMSKHSTFTKPDKCVFPSQNVIDFQTCILQKKMIFMFVIKST